MENVKLVIICIVTLVIMARCETVSLKPIAHKQLTIESGSTVVKNINGSIVFIQK